MAKTSAKLAELSETKLPYISLCMIQQQAEQLPHLQCWDINIAEPGALIAFAGPRVVKDTTGKDLPDGFQKSEFLLEKGFLILFVIESNSKTKLTYILI